METVDEKIIRFRSHNRTMIATALSKPNRRHNGLPSKLLLCAIFDSLSIVAFPNETSVGKRYRDTISKHCNWLHYDKVSLLQLSIALGKSANIPKEFSRLVDWVESEQNKNLSDYQDQKSGLQVDRGVEDLNKLWPSENGKHIKLPKNLLPHSFTHNNLLWMYRNNLAHEFRLLGSGNESPFRMEFEPYYQKETRIDFQINNPVIYSNRWELIYPLGFFVQITKQALESILKEYRKKNECPFSHYKTDSYWV